MTVRSRRSYVRFPDSVETVPAIDVEPASVRMDQLLTDDKKAPLLSDEPQTTRSQNAFDGLEE